MKIADRARILLTNKRHRSQNFRASLLTLSFKKLVENSSKRHRSQNYRGFNHGKTLLSWCLLCKKYSHSQTTRKANFR